MGTQEATGGGQAGSDKLRGVWHGAAVLIIALGSLQSVSEAEDCERGAPQGGVYLVAVAVPSVGVQNWVVAGVSSMICWT